MRPPDFDELLNLFIQMDCRELHLTAGSPCSVVVQTGDLVRLESPALTAKDTLRMMKSITPEKLRQQLEEMQEVEFGLAYQDHVFRIALTMCEGAVSIIARR